MKAAEKGPTKEAFLRHLRYQLMCNPVRRPFSRHSTSEPSSTHSTTAAIAMIRCRCGRTLSLPPPLQAAPERILHANTFHPFHNGSNRHNPVPVWQDPLTATPSTSRSGTDSPYEPIPPIPQRQQLPRSCAGVESSREVVVTQALAFDRLAHM